MGLSLGLDPDAPLSLDLVSEPTGFLDLDGEQ